VRPETKALYEREFKRCVEWARRDGVVGPERVNERVMAAYITGVVKERGPSSARTAMVAIWRVLQWKGTPMARSETLRRLFDAVGKMVQRNRAVDKAPPLPTEALVEVARQFRRGQYGNWDEKEALVVVAGLALGMRFSLRGKSLCDIQLGGVRAGATMKVVIPPIKHSAARVVSVDAVAEVEGGEEPLVCPVRAVLRVVDWRREEGASGQDPLFVRRVRKGGWGATTTDWWTKVVKEVMRRAVAAGVVVAEEGVAYTSRSIRVGGADTLLGRGVSKDAVKFTGNWTSEAVDLYLRGRELARQQVSSTLFGREEESNRNPE
jgi:hypothetical protein